MCMCTCLCGVCAHAVLVTFLPAVLDRMEGPVWIMASAGSVHHREAAHIVIEGKQRKGRAVALLTVLLLPFDSQRSHSPLDGASHIQGGCSSVWKLPHRCTQKRQSPRLLHPVKLTMKINCCTWRLLDKSSCVLDF